MVENIFYYNSEGEKIELEEVPVIQEGEKGEEFFSFADILRAEQKRVAKKFDLSINHINELLALYAPVKSKIKGIKQKFRFNKIIFYIGEGIKNEFGENILEHDSIYAAGAGPIPEHLEEDIKYLNKNGLVHTYIKYNNKKIPKSDQNYDKLMKKKAGSGVVVLTEKGEELSEELWIEMDKSFGDEFLDIITKTKEKIIYMDTEQLKEKVHSEYPGWKKDYTKNDTENYFM